MLFWLQEFDMEDRTGKVWSVDETILALQLYYLIEAGKAGVRSKAINDLAKYLGRTPGSVEMKIGNLQFCDNKNTKGLKNGGKTDLEVFNHFLLQPESLDLASKRIIEKHPENNYLIPALVNSNPYIKAIDTSRDSLKDSYEGSEAVRLVKQRKDQDCFRNRLLANYDKQCCLSHVHTTQLLLASHIVPWSKDEKKRLDPRNGLLLNAFLDKAFDKGIITVDANDFTVVISEKLKDEKALEYLGTFKGLKISLPKNEMVWPEKENLQYHNDVIFNKYEEAHDVPTFEQYHKTLLAM